jgi:hypothetical protein
LKPFVFAICESNGAHRKQQQSCKPHIADSRIEYYGIDGGRAIGAIGGIEAIGRQQTREETNERAEYLDLITSSNPPHYSFR